MTCSEMKQTMGTKMQALIDKHELSMYGEPLEGDVYCVSAETTFDVVFNDEHMAYLIAGHVSECIYAEFEAIIEGMGCEIIDMDGNRITLRRKG